MRVNRLFALATPLCIAVFAFAPACRRSRDERASAPDRRLACERGLGRWAGDDVLTLETDPNALAIAREAIRVQRWHITENSLETHEDHGRPTTEALRVTADEADHCDIELTLGDRARTLRYRVQPDGRLRVGTIGGAVSMLLRRDE